MACSLHPPAKASARIIARAHIIRQLLDTGLPTRTRHQLTNAPRAPAASHRYNSVREMESGEGTLWKALQEEVEGYKQPIKAAVERSSAQIDSALHQLNSCLWPAQSGKIVPRERSRASFPRTRGLILDAHSAETGEASEAGPHQAETENAEATEAAQCVKKAAHMYISLHEMVRGSREVRSGTSSKLV